MNKIIQRFFLASPRWLKELAVMAEAKRRNYFRRYGDYSSVRRMYSFEKFTQMSGDQLEDYQVERLNELFRHAHQKCKFYGGRLPSEIKSLDDLGAIPVLTKADVQANLQQMIAHGYPRRHLFWSQSSGSTGTPINYCNGREGIRARFAVLDDFYELGGVSYGDRRARISGVQVAPVNSNQPPFWIYNRVDNQLQFSAYHLSQETAPYYFKALNEFEPEYITGYTHAIYLLASYIISHDYLSTPVKAVFPDSENLLPEYRPVIEKAFQAPCYDCYGIGETTGGAFQCSAGQYAEISLVCKLEILDNDDNPVKPGETGRIIMTDFTNYGCPFIRYDTGDLATLTDGCSCRWSHALHISDLVGRLDDMILTPKGRWVGRLSHVTKPGIGIRESQIVQKRLDLIQINVVAAENFDPESMKKVVRAAHDYIGDDVEVTWQLVNDIPRNSGSHKVRHVVREIKTGKPAL